MTDFPSPRGLVPPSAAGARRPWLDSSYATAVVALLVCAGCYIGALAGVALTFPAVGAAVVFLPYAVLLTVLCVSRPRQWWLFLLASTLGNYLPHRDAGAGASAGATFVLLTEAANYTRVLVAAIGMRRFGFGVRGLDDLRGMAAFLVFGVGLGPAVGAFLGALVVTRTGLSHDYGLIWQEWFLSNALSALAFLPIFLSVASVVRTSRRERTATSTARNLEAVALAFGLFAAGVGVFVLSRAEPSTIAARLYLPLPLLLWAAVRFTPASTSAALLLIASVTVWGALHGRGPFIADSPTQNLLHLQMFLIALSLPLLLLTSLAQQARRTAEELSESREQYRSVVEEQTEMICRFLPDGTYTFANAAYAAFHGEKPSALVGRTLHAVLPDAVRLATAEHIRRITWQSPLVAQDVETTDLIGERRWQHWRHRGFFDASGDILEYQSVGRDITDRHRAQEERQRLAAQTEITAALRDADRRKDEFLALLGHELRNPLAPLGAALELLRQHETVAADARHAHEIMARQLGHMTRLVDDLLDVSRISRGTIELRLAMIDLREVVKLGIETSRPAIESRRHAMVVSLPENPLWMRGDATRLTQIVGNLLHNAAKYTEQGGRIEVAARRDGDSALLSVLDNGIGISPQLLGDVFELFMQAPSRVETARGGLGVGLTLVRRLAELHGGSVQARSDGPGQGSEFLLRLPLLSRGAVAGPREPGAAEPAHDPNLRILVVDDNLDAAEALTTLLAAWGYTARTVHDGAAALETVPAFAPDVVLLDLDLPKVDGYEVAHAIREMRGGSRPLLVALTGFGQKQHRERTREIGFDHHLVKPVDIPALRRLLRGQVPT